MIQIFLGLEDLPRFKANISCAKTIIPEPTKNPTSQIFTWNLIKIQVNLVQSFCNLDAILDITYIGNSHNKKKILGLLVKAFFLGDI